MWGSRIETPIRAAERLRFTEKLESGSDLSAKVCLYALNALEQ